MGLLLTASCLAGCAREADNSEQEAALVEIAVTAEEDGADAEPVEEDGEVVYEIAAPTPTPTPKPTSTPTPTPVPIVDCTPEKGYISGNGINLRSGPGTEFEILTELKRGVTLTITGTADDWYRVETEETGGFVAAEFVGKGEVPPAFTVERLSRHNGAVTASSVNMRSEPTTKSDVLEKLKLFTHVTITGETEKWYQVEYQGEKGYMTKEYVEPSQGYYSAEELYLTAQIVHQEARGSLEGQIAVANVIYNRLRSYKFPGSLEKIIFQKGQFSPAQSESRLRSVKANHQAVKAVLEIFVRGKTILPRNVLYFRAGRLGTQWSGSRTYYGTYGGNCFFK